MGTKAKQIKEIINNGIMIFFNLEVSIIEKSSILNRATKVKIKYEKRDKLMPERGTLDITKAKKILSYSPENDLKTGIQLENSLVNKGLMMTNFIPGGFSGIANYKDVLTSIKGYQNWDVITAGIKPPDPTRLFSSSRLPI